jgi:hypothetical protein
MFVPFLRRSLAGAVCALALLPAAASADNEPNDLRIQAEAIAAAPFTSTGTLATENDVDLYAVYVGAAGTQIHANVHVAQPHTGCADGFFFTFCDISVSLYAADGISLASDSARVTSDEPGPLDAGVSWSAATAGTYYVGVQERDFWPADQYQLTVDANQPLLSYKPETCQSARTETRSRRNDLGKAVRAERAAKKAVAKARGARRASARRKAKKAAKLVKFQKGRVNAQIRVTRNSCGGHL